MWRLRAWAQPRLVAAAARSAAGRGPVVRPKTSVVSARRHDKNSVWNLKTPSEHHGFSRGYTPMEADLWRTFASIRGTSDFDKFQDALRAMESSGLRGNQDILAAIMRVHARRRDLSGVRRLSRQIFEMYPLVGKARKRDDGDTLNILTYNAMLKCLADVGDVEAVNALLQEMNEIGPAPDAKSFNVVLRFLREVGRREESAQLAKQIANVKTVEPLTVENFTLILSVLGDLGDIDTVESLWDEHVVNRGLRPNERSYLALLGAHSSANNYAGVVESFTRAQSSGVIDLHVYNAFVKATMKEAQRSESQRPRLLANVRHVFAQMRNGVGVDRVTYISILSYLRELSSPEFREWIIAELDRDLEQAPPDTMLFNALLDTLPLTAFEDRLELFRKLIALGARADAATFNTLLVSASLRKNHIEVVNLMREMEAHGLQMDEYSYNSVILTLIHSDASEDKVIDMFNVARKHKLKRPHVYNAVLKFYFKKRDEAKMREVLQMMREDQIAPDVVTSSLFAKVAAIKQTPEALGEYMAEFVVRFNACPDSRALMRLNMSFPLHDSVWVNLLLDSKNGKVPNLTPHALYTALRRLVGDSHMGYRLHEEMIKHYQEIKDEAAEQRAREALAAVNAELQKSLARRARGKQRRVNRAQVRRPPQARVQFAMDILGDGTLPSVP